MPPKTSTLSLTLVALVGGCYLSHDHGHGSGPMTDASLDANPSPDGGDPMDGGWDVDANPPLDGSFDAGPDAFALPDGWSLDSEPPLEPPPDPTTCRIEPAIHPFDGATLEQRWPEQGGDMVNPASLQVCATPLVIDLNPRGEGEVAPVVVFVSYDGLGDSEAGTLRIWDPRTQTTISYPDSTGPMGPFGPLEPSTNLAAGDLDGDGDSEIVGLGVSSGTYAFHHDGTLMWESPYPSAVERGLRFNRTIGGAITLADLEGDGTVEVIAGRTVLEGATGEHRWTSDGATSRGANGNLGPISCVADLDGDGIQEIIAGNSALRADNGEPLWFTESVHDGFCAIADMIPSDPGVEIVLVATGYLYVLDERSGDVLWMRTIEGRGTRPLGGPPTIADFDGDGRPEIGVAHGSRYGVYDLDCVRRDPAAGCMAEGVRWAEMTEDDSSAATGSSVFDFNGDGRAEVVYNDQFFFRIYDGSSGAELFRQPNSSRTRTENPVIADVDIDGDAEIVFSANSEASFLQRPRNRTTDPGVEIWGDSRGRWVGARRIWNQHSYHITNVSETGQVSTPAEAAENPLNAYRQNLREGGDVLVVPDLWGGRGRYECEGPGQARIAIDVQNWGLERAGAGVLVRLYRGHPSLGVIAGEARTRAPLLPRGGSETVEIRIELGDGAVDYWAVLDPDPAAGGTVNECREGNNEVLVWRPSCP